MGDLAVAVIVGRLTRDAELKYANSGTAICHFSLATNARVKKGDQWVDESSYWDVDLFGKRAESVNQYLIKGKLVAVQGDMRQDRWEKDGQTRTKVVIIANDVQLLGSSQGGGYTSEGAPPSSSGQGFAPRAAQPAQARPQGNAPAQREGPPNSPPPGGDDFTDDIPF
jgi:single-strand DNA-binding protein